MLVGKANIKETGFPWEDLPKDSVVVDVGGGIGSMSVMLAQAFPHLRFVVQDRAGVVAIAPQVRPPVPLFQCLALT